MRILVLNKYGGEGVLDCPCWLAEQFSLHCAQSPHLQLAAAAAACAVLCCALTGMWMDNDVVLYQDLTHLLSISYQFVMRW